ncbi:MAG: TPM domain-containing protein [Erysipelotrichaceae bacterium]|nr:TPM domain-containing protein [Erysipelotrichaceae bacterium]
MKKLTKILMVLILLVLGGANVYANDSGVVFDEGRYLTPATKLEIQKLYDESPMSKYGFRLEVIETTFPQSMEEYRIERFNQKNVGFNNVEGKEQNSGILFILAVKDRKFSMTYGDGMEGNSHKYYFKSSHKYINQKANEYLKNQDWDQAVIEIVKGIVNELNTTTTNNQNTPKSDNALMNILKFIGPIILIILGIKIFISFSKNKPIELDTHLKKASSSQDQYLNNDHKKTDNSKEAKLKAYYRLIDEMAVYNNIPSNVIELLKTSDIYNDILFENREDQIKLIDEKIKLDKIHRMKIYCQELENYDDEELLKILNHKYDFNRLTSDDVVLSWLRNYDEIKHATYTKGGGSNGNF